jgi:predicted nucleic acid-binding protein
MDRVFLDANVLFSAAYRASSGLLALWKVRKARLCSSRYAVEEARINLDEAPQRERLIRLSFSLELFEAQPQELPGRMVLPEKDVPIMLAAISARATHLLTGDGRHFGPYFGRTFAGILVLPPADYLRLRAGRR